MPPINYCSTTFFSLRSFYLLPSNMMCYLITLSADDEVFICQIC